jgi:hypothetical protein
MYLLPAEYCIAQVLRDPTIGLNAALATAIADGLQVGTLPLPEPFQDGAIANEYEDPNVADGEFPAFEQALAIEQVDQFNVPAEIFLITGERTIQQFPLMLRYRSGKSDQAAALQDWFYWQRIIGRVLRTMMREAHVSLRRAAGVGIIGLGELAMVRSYRTKAGTAVTGGAGILLELRDRIP